jgi:hypothetical protein
VRFGRLSGTTLKPHYAHKVDLYECSGQDVHGILRNRKCFLETILNDAAGILRMDNMEQLNSGRGQAEDTRGGFQRRSE